MNTGIALSEKEIELIEKVEVLYQKRSIPPVQAKIIGLLMVSPKEEVSSNEIVETLKLSKSAVNKALTQLLSLNKISYTVHMESKTRYYKNNPEKWKDDAIKFCDHLHEFADVLDEIIMQRPASTQAFNEDLKIISKGMRHTAINFPPLFNKWTSRSK